MIRPAVAFGARLRELRKKADLTQEELASRADLHVTYLSGIERGRRNPSLTTIYRLADSLGIHVRELFPQDG